MKNKKLTYILVPLVGLIWGLVIYKMFNYTDDTNYSYANTSSSLNVEEIVQEIDTFTIIAKYKDPFLGRKIYRKTSTTSNNTIVYNDDAPVQNVKKNTPNQTKKNKSVKSSIKWPKIEFGGIIYNAKTKNSVALIKINNKEHLAKVGDEINRVELLKVYPDSINIQFEEEIKTIKRN